MIKERRIFPIFKARANGGRIYFDNEKDVAGYLQNLNGQILDVIIKKEVKHRSRQEEKFYYGVVINLIAEEMCVEAQQAHEFLKGMFLRVEERTPGGRRFERVLSTVELSDKAYQDYWKKCQAWAGLPTNPAGLGINSGLGLYIPDPNEVDYENY